MTTAADALTPPPGWTAAAVELVADINKIDPNAQVEIETSPDFYTLSLFGLGDVLGNVPSVATELDNAAQQFGSRVYAVVLMHTVEFDFLGVRVDRYRFVIVHSQFQAIAVLVALPVIIGLVAVWLECRDVPAAQCGQMLSTNAHDAGQALCNIFGAACALQSLGVVLLATAGVGVAFAAFMFTLETGVAQRLGIKAPALPPVRAPAPPAGPRVSVSTPSLGGFGPGLRVSSGGGGGRRGGGRG